MDLERAMMIIRLGSVDRSSSGQTRRAATLYCSFAISLFHSHALPLSLPLSPCLSLVLWLARTHTARIPLFLSHSLARRCCCLCEFLHPLRIVDCYRQCRVSLSAISCTPNTKLNTCSLFSQAMHSLPFSLSHSGWGRSFLLRQLVGLGR